MDEVTATEDPDQPGWWKVTVRGTVTNNTTGDVQIEAVYVHVDGDPPVNVSVDAYAPGLARERVSPWERRVRRALAGGAADKGNGIRELALVRRRVQREVGAARG